MKALIYTEYFESDYPSIAKVLLVDFTFDLEEAKEEFKKTVPIEHQRPRREEITEMVGDIPFVVGYRYFPETIKTADQYVEALKNWTLSQKGTNYNFVQWLIKSGKARVVDYEEI